jgi:hypothetical protein
MIGMDIIRDKIETKIHCLCAKNFEDDDTLFNLLLASAAIPLIFYRVFK